VELRQMKYGDKEDKKELERLRMPQVDSKRGDGE
jgi:hypothetical protein